MQATQTTEQWRGEEKIVLGIDIGTTFTAIAYAYLYAGGPQVVKRVTEWPGQPAQRYESKVPTIVWYDRYGRPQSFCAEAHAPAIVARAEREGWSLAAQFKLHVHPSSMPRDRGFTMMPLPPRVPVEQIYGDILGYIFRHAQAYFEDKEFELEGGSQTWRKLALENRIHFVICHPSGWGLQEQNMLRQATLRAGLLPSLEMAADRVQFVTEAEASVHFFMLHADLQNRLQPGIEFAICDAGGSTIDTTIYTVSSVFPALALREQRDSACVQAGGIFVDQAASNFFQEKFRHASSPDQISEYLSTAMQKFVTEIKPSFENPSLEYPIGVADRQVVNLALGIDRGYLSLMGYEVEGFFSACIDKIIESIQAQIRGCSVRYVLLAGGFGESPYLRRRLRNDPGLRHIAFTVPDQSGAKAASEGSVLWTLKKSVVARATRFAFGVSVLVTCGEQYAYQLGRSVVRRQDGSTGVAGGWSEIVPKGHVIEDEAEVSRGYERQYDEPAIRNTKVKDVVYMYDQNQSTAGTRPVWIRGPIGELLPGFQEICTIETDLSLLQSALKKKKLKSRDCFQSSKKYWVLDYRIAFTFGSTELKAFVVWEENGVTLKGPVSVIPINRAL